MTGWGKELLQASLGEQHTTSLAWGHSQASTTLYLAHVAAPGQLARPCGCGGGLFASPQRQARHLLVHPRRV
jgi:hypothetical protein